MGFHKFDEKEQKRMKEIEKDQQREKQNLELSTNDTNMNYILDTNILYFIHNDKENNIIKKLVDYSKGKKIIFNLVGKMILEYNDLKERKEKIEEQQIDVEKKFKEVGSLTYRKSGKTSDLWEWAVNFSHNKWKSYNELSGKKPDVVDCLLLKYYLDNPTWVLVTHDIPLKRAAKGEGQNFREESIFDPIEDM
jgi:hypothetical protein